MEANMAADHRLMNNLRISMSIEADRVASSLWEMIGYRKRVAQQLNIISFESKQGKELQKIMEHVNGSIKDLLGL